MMFTMWIAIQTMKKQRISVDKKSSLMLICSCDNISREYQTNNKEGIPLKRTEKPLTGKVYDFVYDGIINGTITNNDILTENALVEELGVSKSPVRGALILLCEENVIQSIPRLGYKVLQITPDQVQKLTEARFALEPFMLEKAWPLLQAEQMMQLTQHLRQCKETELKNTSIRENWIRNIQFHTMLASFAQNEYLLSSLEYVLRSCARAAAQYYLHTRGIPQGEADYHDAIVEAIVQHDLQTAQAMLKQDIQQII